MASTKKPTAKTGLAALQELRASLPETKAAAVPVTPKVDQQQQQQQPAGPDTAELLRAANLKITSYEMELTVLRAENVRIDDERLSLVKNVEDLSQRVSELTAENMRMRRARS